MRVWCEAIAGFDMCVLGSGSKLEKLDRQTAADRRLAKSVLYYIYPIGEGNTAVLADKYGLPLRLRDVDAVISAITADMCGVERPYRRLLPALNALVAARETWGNSGKLKVLFYGH